MTEDNDLIVTIDGPSGAGKSTVAKILARALKYAYLDTGAMYRGVAYAYMKEGEPADIGRFLKNLVIDFTFGTDTKVFLDGEDISGYIRDPEVSLWASSFSQNRVVREYLTGKQRDIGRKGGIVLEGRDTGSIVFPDAEIKFYIDANPEERAKRRHLELSSKGMDAERATVEKEMAARDKNDSERAIAPLVIPKDAIRVDTTGIDAQQVVDIMVRRISERSR
ncbi:MAG: (d)CMP kinase [Syntrophus sp. (in: bacteria)]|nr:(d)CMP kinase [Syntrophus sp. (in: bacteria)]